MTQGSEVPQGLKALKAIFKLKSNVKKAGIAKDGKGNFNKIFSLDALEASVDKHSPDGLEMIFISAVQADNATSGNLHVARTTSKYVFISEDDIIEFPVTGLGSDRNDVSFAEGKALTYSRRYFLLGLLGLASKDLEPDNKDQLLQEVRLSLTTKMKEDVEKAASLKAAYKERYGQDLDIAKLDLETLQNIDNKF